MNRCLTAFWVMGLVIAGLATAGANAATDGNGRMLWGADFSGTVYSIDPTSGDREAAFQFEFQGPVPRAIHDLTYNPDSRRVLDLATGAQPGRIFALHGSSELIFSIATPGGPVETIGTFEQVGFSNAMAYDPWDDRFFISDTRLHEIDPVTGETIRILSDDSYSALTMVPEPSSALLVLAGVVAFAVGRGRGVMGLIQARSASEWISS